MTTFADSLKKEIARIARKELKEELASLRKSNHANRMDIAALKRELRAVKAKLPRTPAPRALTEAEAPAASGTPKPFDHLAFGRRRKELGMTQDQMARLVEASSLSIWKWESGRVHPRAGALARIQAAQKLGKRAAWARVTGGAPA